MATDNDLRAALRRQLAATISRTDFDGLGDKYEGKVRDCYITGDGRRIIVVSDRLSAFDRVITTIPSKGHVLNRIAEHWFKETAHIAPNHVLEVPDPNVMIGIECTPLKVELVMRSYLTGVTSTSIWRAYERGDRVFCGHRLPDGMAKNQPLPEPLLTPTSKADKGDHDVSMSREELIASGAVTARDFDRAGEIAAALFAFGQKRAAERGLILVDTKYEMGRAPSGEIVVIDEIHTPDSSRYWYADDHAARMAAGQEPRSLDKEFVRRWLAEQAGYRGDGPLPVVPDDIRVEAAARYVEICELVTGRPFEPDEAADPVARIARNLGLGPGGKGGGAA
ncbi:MAG TPA: phosphoribosylaminoimidazolesuccinocarboxamide synthase [Kofleriaceae bacterium]|nr:phosphoribosylaminoimidazolesuccinocarboxamide synthase [Kofleriaceae bacterium]